jgi:hypothetical protein
MSGLITFSTAMWFQHISLILQDGSVKFYLSYPLSFFSKISTDILGAAFGLSSGMLGTIAFIYVTNFNIEQDFWLLTSLVAVGFISIGFLTLFVGFLLWLLKSYQTFSHFLKRVNLPTVLLAYPVTITLFVLFLWFYKP